MLSNSGYREAKQPPNLWHIDGDTLFSIWDGAFLKMPRPQLLFPLIVHTPDVILNEKAFIYVMM